MIETSDSQVAQGDGQTQMQDSNNENTTQSHGETTNEEINVSTREFSGTMNEEPKKSYQMDKRQSNSSSDRGEDNLSLCVGDVEEEEGMSEPNKDTGVHNADESLVGSISNLIKVEEATTLQHSS